MFFGWRARCLETNIQTTNKKKNKIDVLLCAFLFLAVFLPPLAKKDMSSVVQTIDCFILFIYLLKYKSLRINRRIVAVLAWFLPFFFYYSIAQFLRTVEGVEIRYTFFYEWHDALESVVYIILTGLAILAFLKVKNLDFDDYIRHIIAIMAIQLFLVLLAFFSPEVKQFFIEMIRKNSVSRVVVSATDRESYFRCFGFANNLFDSFGYITSLGIIVTLVYGVLSKKIWPKLLAVFFLIMPLFNARTGLVLSALGIVIVFFQNFDRKKIVQYLFIAAVSAVAVVFVMRFLPSGLSGWIKAGFRSTVDLFHGKRNGVYSEILSADLVWPSSLLFGDGAPPETIGNYSGIDSGYIQCLWRFGIVGSLLLFLGYYKLFFMTRSRSYSKYLTPIAAIYFVYLFKLYGIANVGSVPLVFAIPLLARNEEGLLCDEERYPG